MLSIFVTYLRRLFLPRKKLTTYGSESYQLAFLTPGT